MTTTYTSQQIAERLGVSKRTANNYAKRLGVRSVPAGGGSTYVWTEADETAARELIARGDAYGSRPHKKRRKSLQGKG